MEIKNKIKMENKERFVQLPKGEEVLKDITPQDQLIYLAIRSFMNKDTMECFPSLDTIAERAGASVPTIRKCIKNLQDKDYLKVIKTGRSQKYRFNKLKQFEPFSYDFLNNKDLSFTNKAFLAAAQTYMYDKESGTGKISYNKMELAEKINMSYRSVVKNTNELVKKDIMSLQKIASGKQEMQFNFERYNQGIVRVLLNHEERIDENEYEIRQMKEQMEQMRRELASLKKENSDLKNDIVL